MTALMSGTRLLRLRVVKVCLVSDCSGLSKWIFMSPTKQANPGGCLCNQDGQAAV